MVSVFHPTLSGAPARQGDWIQTYSGRPYWPHDPRPEDVFIEDIAHHLSLLCRYTGAVERFYSVAEHSVYVSYLVPMELALAGLLHDAHEAYVNDLAKPTKTGLGDYARMEELNWHAVADRFHLSRAMPAEVHKADLAMLRPERAQLMKPCSKDWGLGEGYTPNVGTLGLDPKVAEQAFLLRFRQITELIKPLRIVHVD